MTFKKWTSGICTSKSVLSKKNPSEMHFFLTEHTFAIYVQFIINHKFQKENFICLGEIVRERFKRFRFRQHSCTLKL